MVPVRVPLRSLHEDVYIFVVSMQAPSARDKEPAVLVTRVLPTECSHFSRQRVRIVSYAKKVGLACH